MVNPLEKPLASGERGEMYGGQIGKEEEIMINVE